MPPGGNPHHVRYLQAALDAEVKHAALASAGARSPYRHFYFPAHTFRNLGTAPDHASFLGVMDILETVGEGICLTASRKFLRLGYPDLAIVVAEVMGVEAEHRMLHEVLWVLRDCLSGEVLLARSLLSSTADDLAALLQEVKEALPVPLAGVISDGAHPIRRAIQRVLPAVPHQLYQFHDLREAAKPAHEADRHATTLLKKEVRGVRPIERSVEVREDGPAEVVRGYCRAVRSALTDDGRPPLAASGLQLYDRLHAIQASLEQVAHKSSYPALKAGPVPGPALSSAPGPIWKDVPDPRTPRSCAPADQGRHRRYLLLAVYGGYGYLSLPRLLTHTKRFRAG